MLDEVLSLIWALLMIVVVLALAYLFTRYVAGIATVKGFKPRGRKINILEQIAISKDQKLLLVKVGEKVYFLGSSQGSINQISEISKEELSLWEEEDEAFKTSENMSFKDALKKVMSKNQDGGNNGSIN